MGGAVSAAAVLIIVLVLGFWYVRKKRASQGAANELDGSRHQPVEMAGPYKDDPIEMGVQERPQELMSDNHPDGTKIEQSPSSDSFRVARKPVELSA